MQGLFRHTGCVVTCLSKCIIHSKNLTFEVIRAGVKKTVEGDEHLDFFGQIIEATTNL